MSNEYGGAPLSGDILNHNGHVYVAHVDPDYDGTYDPASSMGLGYMWVSEDADAPDVPYDKTKLKFRGIADHDVDVVRWEIG